MQLAVVFTLKHHTTVYKVSKFPFTQGTSYYMQKIKLVYLNFIQVLRGGIFGIYVIVASETYLENINEYLWIGW